MTAPNVNTLWGRIVVDELVKAGVDAVCVAPGSRSTPLAVAAAETDAGIVSLLDERSAGFFALGRAKRTGQPTPLVSTSGTAAAEFHPAVVEADRSRTPMVLLTADRPPELQDSGANQTVDQTRLYGDAVRWYRTLPEPSAEPRTLRSLRTTVARAVSESTGSPAGPVHLNVPFAKPLEPREVPEAVAEDLGDRFPAAVRGRAGPFIEAWRGTPTLDSTAVREVVEAIRAADRGLVVAGPAGADDGGGFAAGALGTVTGFPVLADPLSGARFGPWVERATVLGGYDAYLGTVVSDGWAAPDVIVRFGAAPTSKALRRYLAETGARQFVVDPAGGWREATFTASDLVVADPEALVEAVRTHVEDSARPTDGWRRGFEAAESAHWTLVDETDALFEGGVAAVVAARAPDPATVFVSSSTPVRDFDRFGRPRPAGVTALGNRGASGIDGITSAAIGAGSTTDEPLVVLTGDLAFYHDLTGLLALERADVEATVVLVNNDGGGIFHDLPIAAFDPPFTELFETPHGLEFGHAAELFGLRHAVSESIADFESAYGEALEADGSDLIEVRTDAADSFAVRDRLQAELIDRLG